MELNHPETSSSPSINLIDKADKEEIKANLISGLYQIQLKQRRSLVWGLFGDVVNEEGQVLENVVACRICKQVFFSNSFPKTTSNLVRHKCYTPKSQCLSNAPKKRLSKEDNEECARLLTEWIVENCISYEITKDEGLKKFFHALISLGYQLGESIDVKELVPNPMTISNGIEEMYAKHFEELKTEISGIKDIGFGITCDLWTDDYVKQTNLAVTIHYILDGSVVNKLLGIEPMESHRCTASNFKSAVDALLDRFDCKISGKTIVVSGRQRNMAAAFASCNHLNCIYHLLEDCINKACSELSAVKLLVNACTQLLQYLKSTETSPALQTTLQSWSTNTRWNSVYQLLHCVEKFWAGIRIILEEKGELRKLDSISIKAVSGLASVLMNFERTSRKLEAESHPTIHTVYIALHNLRKCCSSSPEDSELTQSFKSTLHKSLDTMMEEDLSLTHKLALYLFPPANNLVTFSPREKELIRTECKRLLLTVMQANKAHPSVNPKRKPVDDLFYKDFVLWPENQTPDQAVEIEINRYENSSIPIDKKFDVLKWWHSNQSAYPNLYKLSCRILAVPASTAASEKAFLKIHNILSEERTNSDLVDKLLFLHYNNKSEELCCADS